MLKRTSIRRVFLMSYIPSYRNQFAFASAELCDGSLIPQGAPS